MDSGGEARVEISLIKFWGARMLHNVIDRAIQVHGALGVTADTPLEAMYREARYARIYDGPDEVHRMNVARRILKDPYGQRAVGVTRGPVKPRAHLPGQLDGSGARPQTLRPSVESRRAAATPRPRA